MDRTIARIGSWAGFIAVIGIIAYHGSLMAVAGPRIAGSTDAATIATYFGAGGVAALSVEQIFVLVPAIVLFAALRELLDGDELARFLATLGLVAAAIEMALIAVTMAAQAGLVVAVQAGEPGAGTFRYLDVLYNTAADVFEGTWVLAFGLAMRGAATFPRWMIGLSLIASGSLYVKSLAIWIGIPDPVTLPVALLIVAWLVGASLGLRRAGAHPALTPATSRA
jgi:hypothetical protein